VTCRVAAHGSTPGRVCRDTVTPGTRAPRSQTATTVYKLGAGDYVGAYVVQDSGGNLNLQTGVQNGVTMSMQCIAP
jgi:hypothetical protein